MFVSRRKVNPRSWERSGVASHTPASTDVDLVRQLSNLVLAVAGHGASLQTFAVVYGQLTNDIAILEAEFDNSPEQKQTFATLVRARNVILNPELRDEQALAALVDLLEASGYDTTLDEAANNARASVLRAYDAVAIR